MVTAGLRQLKKKYGIGVVFLVLAFVCVIFSVKNFFTPDVYEPSYIETTASIVEVLGADMGIAVGAKITYTAPDGTVRNRTVEFHELPSEMPRAGDNITVSVYRTNSDVVSVGSPDTEAAEKHTSHKLYAVLELAGAAALGAAGVYLLGKKNGRGSIPENAPQPSAKPNLSEQDISQILGSAQRVYVKKENTAPFDKNALIDDIVSEIKSSLPEKQCLSLELSAGAAQRTGSMMGGVPYMPKGEAYPVDINGHPMRLLVQLNMSELPKVEGFDDSGMLQIFISDNSDLWGRKGGHCVIFRNDIISDPFMLMSEADMPGMKHSDDLPFEGSFRVRAGRLFGCAPTACVKGCTELTERLMKERIPESADEWVDMEVYNTVFEKCSNSTTCIGGYPEFIQEDERAAVPHGEKYDTLLFQSVSGSFGGREIVWGDNGNAAFFISHEALEKRDFSDVLFIWQCS